MLTPLLACSAVNQRPYPITLMIDSRSEPMSEQPFDRLTNQLAEAVRP
jgi:hypothetical protein